MAPAVRSSASAYPQIEAVRAQGLEGIVANRNDSRYESGERTGHWVKYLVQCGQELVIGGYRVGKNDFDNSAVGYQNEAGS
jgi:ATP-dependent DNA ligase